MTKEDTQELLVSIERIQQSLDKMIEAQKAVRKALDGAMPTEQEKNDFIVARERYRSGV